MSINGMYGNSTTLRFSGMASGIDTEQIINSLMRVEQMKVDRLTQSRMRMEWLREDYRGIHRLLKDMMDTRFDILKPATNMLSANTYRTYQVSSTKGNLVSAFPVGTVNAGTTTIDRVDSLASSASLTGSRGVSAPLQGSVDLSGGAAVQGKSLTVNLDGITKTIQFTEDYQDAASLTAGLQEKLNHAFGSGRVSVQMVNTENGQAMALKADDSILSVRGNADSALSDLGFINNQGNRVNLDGTLESGGLKLPFLNDGEEALAFEINGVSFSFEKGTTLRQMMNDINNSSAGVKLSYSSLTDQFTLTAQQTGEGRTITINNLSGNLFGNDSAVGITETYADNGTNAVLSINGTVVTRNTNTFNLDGIQYTLHSVFSGVEGPVTITSSYDAGAAVDRIKAFINQYNDVIEQIHSKLSQEQFRGYHPLTDIQKREMTDREIEMWEDKAKSGLLRGDRILEGIVRDMRRALSDTVENSGISLSAIGITTGPFFENGKLHVDEAKLTKALEQMGPQVEKLLSGQSQIRYSPTLSQTERGQRYREAGLMHRISDILNDYIRTSRNTQGLKGTLLEKAGIIGDTTEFRNLLSDDIRRIDRRIDGALRSLQIKEQTYWSQFTAMEKAIQQMNTQSSWLMQQMNSGW